MSQPLPSITKVRCHLCHSWLLRRSALKVALGPRHYAYRCPRRCTASSTEQEIPT